MMKKYVLFLAITLTISGNSNANPRKNFDSELDSLQTRYPIIKELREDWRFKVSSAVRLKTAKKSPQEIIKESFEENIQCYIDNMSLYQDYWNIVKCSGSLYLFLKRK